MLACTPGQGGWDPASLAPHAERLGRHAGHRLADARPYFAPAAGGVVLFLCRWPDGRAIPVSLPEDATAPERERLRGALRAWEAEGLGVVFEEVPRPSARIRIDFVARSGEEGPAGSANTAADCRVKLHQGRVEMNHGAVSAELVRASIHLRRENLDLLERPVPLADDRALGTVLHEIGHALGFPSHAASGNSLMGRSVSHVRRAGSRVLRGERIGDPTLRALYALPSGVVVGHAVLLGETRLRLNELQVRAQAEGWDGPEVRVGDRSTRIAWWDERGRPVGFLVSGELGAGRPWLATAAARELGY
jgi:hypothetical protein